jgi:hypothetical protein
MKTKFIITLGMILLIGIVSANLVDFLSNSVTGAVKVEGPVFYLDGIHSDGGVYHKLYINQIPSKEDIYFWDGHRLVFKTENLDVNDFYKAKFSATIYIKSNNEGNTIQARFIKLNGANQEKTICEAENPITIQKDVMTAESFSCESTGEIDLSSFNRFGLELRGNGDENQSYWISVGDESNPSKIEVSLA